MDANVIDSEGRDKAREGEGEGRCECGAPSLAVLGHVHAAYCRRMELLERAPHHRKLQMQVDLLRSWVSDLAGQNSLLARAVEELEAEATTRLFLAERKHSEMVCEVRAEAAVLRRRLARARADVRGLVEVLRRLREFDFCTLDGIHFFEVTESDIFGDVEWQHKKMAQGDAEVRNVNHNTDKMKNRHRRKDKRGLCDKVNELKILNDSLHKENIAKDREIRKLHKDAQQYEQTIMNLRSEISHSCHTLDVSKKDAQVMTGMSCTGAEYGDWEPVKDIDSVLREEMASYQDRIQKMENSLKSSGDDVRVLRKVNVSLREELNSLRGACAALSEQCRAALLRGQFKDEIIREMRRQLMQAKAKTKEASSELMSLKSRSPSRDLNAAYDSVTIACVRQQPRRSRDPASRSLSADRRSPRLVVSGEDLRPNHADVD